MNRRSELFLALGAFAESPAAAARSSEALGLDVAPNAEEHTRLFSLLLQPYASIYAGVEGMLGGEAAARVAGFWRALGYTPPAEADHLSSLLGLHAALLDAERSERDRSRALLRHEARAALLWEHVLVWVPVYATKVAQASASYEPWARLLLDVLLAEAAELGEPDTLPLHAREAPGWPAAISGSAELTGAVLAPIRSGIVVTRDDLTSAGRDLRLGVRIGERAYVLRSLLEQDAPATIEWLAGEARLWQTRHARLEVELGSIARFWKERARAAELALASESEAAGGVIASGARG